MKRIIIICEGSTEREFGKTLLSEYFMKLNIHVQCPLIKRTMGGVVKWKVLKKEIETYLIENDVYVTMLIDYYGIYSKLNFPFWAESLKIPDKSERMQYLENAMQNDIKDSVRHRFIPYLQLHEFEALLFNDIQVFYDQIPQNELIGIEELKQVFIDYPNNPEMINDKKETSPSHRLERIISGYNKVLYGHYFAEAIGLKKIRNKSPRFNNWINIIENIE